ncbi:discoidin domain-containing protein [Paenibacillus silvae]|nr:discoidin domain-containing protein [Paenibacillus silvae]
MPIKVSNVIPKMTSNTAPSGIVSASSIYSSAYDAWYAFNQTNDQGWASNGTSTSQWLCYKFANPVAISQYTLTSRNSGTSSDLLQTPKNWRFEASNDGSNWIKIDERDNITNWGVAEKRVFTFYNNIKFLYYRIYCVSNNGSTTAFAINELEMMEYDYLSKILLSSGDKYSLKDSTVIKMETDSEKNFLNHGADLITNFNGYATKQKDVKNTSALLGSGKTFEHTIDMSKRRTDKIKLG